MKEFGYGLGIETDLSVADAETAVRAALAEEGFGILTEIDVAATLKTKLDVDRAPYRILGACNPALANKALDVDEHVGLLLPCNVVVYQTESGSNIEAMEPLVMSQLVPGEAIGPIAAEARERLSRALQALERMISG
jgi:uncharacterized protein (DUF302 family)